MLGRKVRRPAEFPPGRAATELGGTATRFSSQRPLHFRLLSFAVYVMVDVVVVDDVGEKDSECGSTL